MSFELLMERKMKEKIVVMDASTSLRITTPEEYGRSCVYVLLINGKLEIQGGADLIGEIRGEGMKDKFVER